MPLVSTQWRVSAKMVHPFLKKGFWKKYKRYCLMPFTCHKILPLSSSNTFTSNLLFAGEVTCKKWSHNHQNLSTLEPWKEYLGVDLCSKGFLDFTSSWKYNGVYKRRKLWDAHNAENLGDSIKSVQLCKSRVSYSYSVPYRWLSDLPRQCIQSLHHSNPSFSNVLH